MRVTGSPLCGCLAAFLLAAAANVWAQTRPAERVFQLPRAEIEKALKDLKALSPGKLPTLDGFVSSDAGTLDKYKRPYYQYKVEMHPAAKGATLVRISAKVTAWYAGGTSAAGYRELPSNGRLENDLIERLEEELHQSSAGASDVIDSHSGTSTQPKPTPNKNAEARASVNPPFRLPSPFGQPETRSSVTLPSPKELQQEKRVQQLSEQAMNLGEILRSQSRPEDLAAVRRNGTPVYAKADAAAEVLFRSDAEDEFRVLDESGDWVHVQVSGPSRGWIHRADLEMPSELTAVGGPQGGAKGAAKAEAREDTSLFPGDWSPLRGRMVRIRWVQPETASGVADRWQFARLVFRDAYRDVLRSATKVDGVVIVIDSADGGMIAATIGTLQRWDSGAISDAAFRKECWADPPEALGETASR